MEQDPNQRCAICQGATGARCTTFNVGPSASLGFNCEACGRYEVAWTAGNTWLDSGRLNALQRAALSHQVRNVDRSANLPLITTDWIEQFLKTARLPSVMIQAANLTRAIGDHQSATGQGYFINGVTDTSLVGSFNSTSFYQLLNELRDKGLLTKFGDETRPNSSGAGTLTGAVYGLTLDGWERYEAERRGKISGRYGVLAMKFLDAELEDFSEKTIKPEVQKTLCSDVIHIPHSPRAGLLPNTL